MSKVTAGNCAVCIRASARTSSIQPCRHEAAAAVPQLPLPARSEHRRHANCGSCPQRGSTTVLPGRRSPAIFGRRNVSMRLNAALINGTSSHVFDFDDTILSCAFHHRPGPIAGAHNWHLARIIGPRLCSEFVLAFVLGPLRLHACRRRDLHPAFRRPGGTVTGQERAILGATVACGRMLDLKSGQAGLCPRHRSKPGKRHTGGIRQHVQAVS